MTNEEMLKRLRTEICEVIFTKKDGSEREMICTLKPDIIPHVPATKPAPDKARVEVDYMPVYDLEERAWRAFKPSKVISFIFSGFIMERYKVKKKRSIPLKTGK